MEEREQTLIKGITVKSTTEGFTLIIAPAIAPDGVIISLKDSNGKIVELNQEIAASKAAAVPCGTKGKIVYLAEPYNEHTELSCIGVVWEQENQLEIIKVGFKDIE